MPGTPTHSKITSGRLPATSRHASIGLLAWVDDDVRAQASRAAPHRREVGGDDRLDAAICSPAITARPTGPQPITSAASPGVTFAFATAWTPTAIGSVVAACSESRPFGTGSSGRQHHQLAVAARHLFE